MIFFTIAAFQNRMRTNLIKYFTNIAFMLTSFMLFSTYLTNWLSKTISCSMIVFLTILTLNLCFIFFAFFSYKSVLGWPWDRDGSSHPTKTLSHPGPGIEPGRDRELPSHRDLVPSHSMKKILVSSRSCGMPGWDWDGTEHPVPCQEMLLFYNIYTNIRSIQSMNISLESAHWEL